MNVCRKQLRGRAAAGAWMLMLAGCAFAEPLRPGEDVEPGVVVREQPVQPGLVQTVRVSPARPAPGDTLQITSVVRNRGTGAVEVVSRVCGLDLETDLALGDPFGRCLAYSQQRPLAPGDSVREQESKTVLSRPGSYTLRLRHLLQPEQWISVPLAVRAR